MAKLEAERLWVDARLDEAKALFLEAVAEAGERLKRGVRKADPERAVAYKELLTSFGRLRGAPLFFPYVGSGVGHGSLVELLDGSVKYDMISGIGPNLLGHSHPRLIEAAFDAACSDAIFQGHLQPTAIAEQLMRRLCDLAQMDHCFLSSTGAMANENAVKIAFQKRTPADRLFAFEGGFAGRTLLMAQLSDRPQYRMGLPTPFSVDYLPFYDPQAGQESIDETLALIDLALQRYPGRYAAAIFELVQGERGFYVGESSFFRAVMERLKANGVLIIVDEVQTFARTPSLFAFQHFGLQDLVDIVTVGKVSMSCATLFKTVHKPSPGLLGQTFSSSNSALYAAMATLDELTTQGYYGQEGRIAKCQALLVQAFEQIAERHPGAIRGPWGIGALFAFTLFDGSLAATQAFLQRLFEEGVIAFLAGTHPVRIRFLPPVGAMEEADYLEVAKIVEKALVDAIAEKANLSVEVSR